MRPRKFFYAFAAYIATIGLAVVISAETTHGRRIHASLADLCVTEGTISDLPAHGLSVTLPNVHATMNRETAQDIEARFVYLGPSEPTDPPHGHGHHQFGFELFAQDACNLVYVMWRLEPESSIAVLAKSNPEQHVHADCNSRGTTTVAPELALPLPAVRAGERISHNLHAEVSGATLSVFADDVLVWRGTLPADVLRTHGPVGIHCDNAKLEIVLRVAPPAADAPLLPCKAAAG
ncbi:MAG: hypothetical protein WA211_16375 [Candidatus Acidiferrales bacterium]